MRRLVASWLSVLVLLVGAAPPVAAASPGVLIHLEEARVWLVREDPYVACYDLHLTVYFADGWVSPYGEGGPPFEARYAAADYWATNECAGGVEVSPHMTGAVVLEPGDFAINGLKSAWLSDVAIDVEGQGYSQQFHLDLSLTGAGTPIAWNVHNNILLPPGSPDVPPGGNLHNEHYVVADATATVIDLGGRTAFTTADIALAEIGEFVQLNP